ncbi:hypothetical protein BGZ73_006770 [Actinomortierella ambigua]|nr:hypothetical protein BGZ73_006770 [Actinomortierella ambigua]
MKLSFVAALATTALAITSDAAKSRIRLYDKDMFKGNCKEFIMEDYDSCYTISEFFQPRAAQFLNGDPFRDGLSITFFETGNCGGKYTRASHAMKQNVWQSWGKLQNVYGIAGSVMVRGPDTAGNGKITQYKRAKVPELKECK